MQRITEKDLEFVLTQTSHLWENVRNKSIFATGGTGFFGKWLSESFIYANNTLSLNANLTILTRNPKAFLQQFPFYASEPAVNFIAGNVLDFEFPEKEYQYIIHAATDADAALNTHRPLVMLDTITAGTRRVLDFAVEKKVTSFLFTSSGAVYGKQPADVTHIKENEYFPVDINNPYSAYAEGKRLAELYCTIYHTHHNLPVKIARGFAFVGPYLPLDKHFAIGNFILNAIRNEDILIKGDGSPYRSYLYAADMVIWLWTILLKGKSNQPYNLGSDKDYSLKSVAEFVARQNRNIGVKVVGKRDPLKPVERYVPSVDLARNDLGLTPYTSIEEALCKTIKFHKQ